MDHKVIDIDTPSLDKVCEQLFRDGYKDPIITTTLHDTVFERPMIVFRKNNSNSDIAAQKQMLVNTLKNVLRNIKVNKYICDIYITLTKDTIHFLYNQTRYTKFKFGDMFEQREISGEFGISSVSKNVYELHVNKETVRQGDKESASNIESFGTFHTHPYDAYEKYNVCIAWPSADDYFSFLYMYGICYSGFHIVSTLEGIYIISLQKYISPEKVVKQFKTYKEKIEFHHGVDYPISTPNCDIVNGKVDLQKIKRYVKRINKKGMFNLVFKTWDECDEPIRLRYASVDKNCLISTEQALFLRDSK